MTRSEFDKYSSKIASSGGLTSSNKYKIQKKSIINSNVCYFHGWKSGKNIHKCPECVEIEKKLNNMISLTDFGNMSNFGRIEGSTSLDGIRIWLRCNMGHKLIYSLEDISRGCRICSSEKFLSPRYRNNAIKLDLKKEEEYRKKQGELLAEARQQFTMEYCKMNEENEMRQVEYIEKFPNVPHKTMNAISYIFRFRSNPFELFRIQKKITLENKDIILNKLRTAFRAHAKLIHPDKNSHPKSADAFHILSDSYNKMKDYIDKLTR
ncbi:hypothetical protein FG386_002530 [Cryptosporidium ryanae]|uniref:uncharacterized protein n=1 Tax=Cryptosporidium ryanae TaxID=515981 RepID=UPI003519FB87|nr:hypothetical protein FG386_002530 [Cryptosporidium ryanae]